MVVTGGTNLILTMWGDQSSAAMNTVHLGFGFGAVFANLLVAPFLGKNKIFSSDIIIPYTITASLCFLIAVGHLLFAIREYRDARQGTYAVVTTVPLVNYSQYSPRFWGYSHLGYGLVMSILWIGYMFFVTANDLTFGKFFFSYLESPKFKLSTKNASLGMIVYWLSYSVS
jgi:hypothetical protein